MTRIRITPGSRRSGFSLTEVLVALFVMAFGLIALLTLFPLGALQMGLALRRDRCIQAADQADGTVRRWWQAYVCEQPGAEDGYFGALENPTATNPGLPSIATVASQPSYPLLLDPIGFESRGVVSPSKSLVAATAVGDIRLPRRSATRGEMNPALLPPVNTLTRATRVCTMPDDITFGDSARPDIDTVPGTVVRQGRYNWAALIQRPVNGDKYVADLKILVFDLRPPGVAGTDDEVVYSGVNIIAPFVQGQNVVVIAPAADTLNLRTGGWVMDGTIDPTNGIRNAEFYRVRSISDPSGTGPTTIELDSSIQKSSGTNCQLYILKGLAEVFEKPQLRPSQYNPQTP